MNSIVFDLDGTLIDSAPDIHAAVALTLADEGAPPLPLAQVQSFVGYGVPTLVERVMKAAGLDGVDRNARMLARFTAHYHAAPANLSVVYPNVVAALAALKAGGYRLGLCTNKPHAASVRILQALGLAEYFDAVVAGDTLPVRKPDPRVLHHAFERLGAADPPGARGRLFVGDSEVDAETATAAGVDLALYTEGYRKTPLAGIVHAHAFADFAELPGIVARAFGRVVA